MASASTDVQALRNRLLIGNIPDDFLRFDLSEEQQVNTDEELARQLQGELMVVQQSPVFSIWNNPSIRGRLTITIQKANLVKNYGLTRMDPYCRVRIGSNIYETATVYNGSKDPVWGKIMMCPLPVDVSLLYFEIFDECQFQEDSRIAWLCLTIPQEVLAGNQITCAYPLSGKQGDDKEGTLTLTLAFVSSSSLTSNGQFTMPGSQHTVPRPTQPPLGTPVYTQQQNVEVTINESDVKDLIEVFPEIEEVVIRSILESYNGDKERATNALLELN